MKKLTLTALIIMSLASTPASASFLGWLWKPVISMTDWVAKATNDTLSAIGIDMTNKHAGSRYFCESLFWASQPKQAAKT